MAVPLRNACQREFHQLSFRIFDELKARLRRTDLCERSTHTCGQIAAARDCALMRIRSGRNQIDKLDIHEQGRAFQHQRCDRVLVLRQHMNDSGRRILAKSKNLRHRLAHHGRGIVEQHQQRAFGGDAIILGHVGNQIGSRQSPCRIRAFTGGSGFDPLKKLPNNHGFS